MRLGGTKVPAIVMGGLTVLAIAAATLMLAAPEGLILVTQVASPTGAAPPPWEAVAASGQVQAHLPGDAEQAWWSVRRGDVLQPLTSVRTGRRGRATLTRSGDLIVIDPRTQVELPLESVETGDAVIQSSGTVLYEVDRRMTGRFKVITPYLVAGVKGTSFVVTVNDRYTAVSVEEGAVEVVSSKTGEILDVSAGESLLHRHEASEMELHDLRAGSVARPEVRREARRLQKLDDYRTRPDKRFGSDRAERGQRVTASDDDDSSDERAAAGPRDVALGKEERELDDREPDDLDFGERDIDEGEIGERDVVGGFDRDELDDDASLDDDRREFDDDSLDDESFDDVSLDDESFDDDSSDHEAEEEQEELENEDAEEIHSDDAQRPDRGRGGRD